MMFSSNYLKLPLNSNKYLLFLLISSVLSKIWVNYSALFRILFSKEILFSVKWSNSKCGRSSKEDLNQKMWSDWIFLLKIIKNTFYYYLSIQKYNKYSTFDASLSSWYYAMLQNPNKIITSLYRKIIYVEFSQFCNNFLNREKICINLFNVTLCETSVFNDTSNFHNCTKLAAVFLFISAVYHIQYSINTNCH